LHTQHNEHHFSRKTKYRRSFEKQQRELQMPSIRAFVLLKKLDLWKRPALSRTSDALLWLRITSDKELLVFKPLYYHHTSLAQKK
jgi:hypothetical protein